MRSAVTGGAGFIGSHVVDHLIGAGHEVVVIDRGRCPHRSDVRYADADVGDFEAVRAATEGCDYIFHLAAVSNVGAALNDPIECVRVNVLGTATVLEAARRNHVRRIVLASTVWVYSGSSNGYVKEDSPLWTPDAGHVYTSSKISAEMLCHDYLRLYGQPFTILRYGIPYGPRMRDELVISIFLRKALKGEPLTLSGDGRQFRNFIYVEDLAAAHTLVLHPKAENQTYNLEGTQRISVRQIAETIDQMLGGGLRVEYGPARLGDYAGKEISGEKARTELGWEATTSFEAGMRRTLAWVQSQAQG